MTGRWGRLAVRGAIAVVAVLALHNLIGWATAKSEASGNMPLMLGLLALLLFSYALLMAVPFAPGIEIGISLLVLHGAEIAPFVYLATVSGLMLSFLVGRFMPHAWLHSFFRDLHLSAACSLLDRIAPLDSQARLDLLRERLPNWLGPTLGHARYVMLAALLNLPGNGLIGGGGGLAFVAGFSRLFRPTATLATVALAVLPMPLLVWLYGSGVLERH